MLARPMDCSAGCAEIARHSRSNTKFSLVTIRVKIAKWSAMQHRRRYDSRGLSPSARDLPVSMPANLHACHRWPTFADLYFDYACSFAVSYPHYACSTPADLYFHYASSTFAGLYSHCSTSAGSCWQHSSADLYPRHSCSRSADLHYHQPSLRYYRKGEPCCPQR